MVQALLRAGHHRALLRTPVIITAGRLRGQRGSIAGALEDRKARGITKAVVRAGAEFELLSIESLRTDEQGDLFGGPQTKTPPAG